MATQVSAMDLPILPNIFFIAVHLLFIVYGVFFISLSIGLMYRTDGVHITGRL